MWLDHHLFIHLPSDRHLGRFHFLAVVSSAALNVRGQVSVCTVTQFFWVNTWEWNCWLLWQFCILLFEELSNCFPQKLRHFTFLAGAVFYPRGTGKLESSPRLHSFEVAERGFTLRQPDSRTPALSHLIILPPI